MVVTLAEALEVLRPNARPLVDWEVLVLRHPPPGEPAERIGRWAASLGPRPTQAELDAVTPEQVLAARAARDPLAAAATTVQANDAFLAKANPTPTEVRDQVRELTRQMNAVIRRFVRV